MLILSDEEVEQLRIILEAAHSHARDDRAWRGVPMPSYFSSNLDLADNRRKLQKAIAGFKARLA